MRKVVICVAPVSRNNKNVVAQEVVDDVLECYEAGATMVHLHPIKQDGSFDPSAVLFGNIVSKIKDSTDMVVQASTGAIDVGIEDRYRVLENLNVSSCTFNSGTFNQGDNAYMVNTLDDMRILRDITVAKKIHCDFCIFEMGMLHSIELLNKEHPFIHPSFYSLVFGFKGAMPADMKYLMAAQGLLRDDVLFGVSIEDRMDFSMIIAGLVMGSSLVRVGFEDSEYIAPGKKAKNNAELIRHTAQIIRMCGCEVATIEETKQILRLN